jgi:hypothetical protein
MDHQKEKGSLRGDQRSLHKRKWQPDACERTLYALFGSS